MDKRKNGEILTARQIEVAKLLALGYTAKEVAERLFISPQTADKHKTNIYKALEIHGLVDLVWHSMIRGFVTMDEYRRMRHV